MFWGWLGTFLAGWWRRWLQFGGMKVSDVTWSQPLLHLLLLSVSSSHPAAVQPVQMYAAQQPQLAQPGESLSRMELEKLVVVAAVGGCYRVFLSSSGRHCGATAHRRSWTHHMSSLPAECRHCNQAHKWPPHLAHLRSVGSLPVSTHLCYIYADIKDPFQIKQSAYVRFQTGSQ